MKKNSLLRSLLIGLSCTIFLSWGGFSQDLTRPGDPKPGKGEPQPRIVGGDDADIANYPYMVSIEVAGVGHFCGGSIISDQWILTAAHCWDGSWSPSIDTNDPNNLTVRAGATSLSSSDGQFRAVEQIILHENWNSGGSASQGHDIALLKLATPLDLSDPNVAVISYATAPDALAGLIEPGIVSTITGWGALSQGGGSPDILQYVEVPIVSNEDANESYGGAVAEDMIAAGFPEGGKDSCQGDSGGPMVVPNAAGNGFIQVGIVSWGNGCAQPGFYGIYTRVTYYEDWIIANSGVRVNQYPGLIISEFADGTYPGGTPRFVEIHNANPTETFDLSSVNFQRYANGGDTPATASLTGVSLAPGQTYVIAGADYSAESWYATVFPNAPDMISSAVSGNGDDVYELYDAENMRSIDVYGVIGQDGTGEFWEYTDKLVKRNPWVINSNGGGFVLASMPEWTLVDYSDDAATPGSHTAETPANDLALVELVDVEDGEVFAICDGDFTASPELIVRNNGTSAITTADLQVTFNGAVSTETITFDTPLAPNERATVTLALVDFGGPSEVSYSVKVATVNGAADGNPTNDEVGVNISLTSGDDFVQVRITTDDYPEETSWAIVNLENEQVIAQQGGFTEIGEVYTSGEVCLNNGYYAVLLLDSYGDGGAFLELLNSAGEVITEVEGAGDEAIGEFCIGCPPAPSELSAMATSTTSVDLNWGYSGTAESFTIFASQSPLEGYEEVGSVEGSSTSFTHTGLNSFEKYYYVVSATQSSFPLAESTVSNVATALTLPGTDYYQDFEAHDPATEQAAGFQFLDVDEDGDNWFTINDSGLANSGSQSMASFSAFNSIFGLIPFTPTNAMVLPHMELNSGSPAIKFYVSSFIPDFAENVTVYVSTTGYAVEDFEAVYSETISSPDWVLREVDLTDFAGQEVYIAIVHDTPGETATQYVFLLDDIAVDGNVIFNDNSVEILDFDFPESLVNCGNPASITPSLTIRNEGSVEVTSVDVQLTYGFAGVSSNVLAPQAITLDEPLSYFQSGTISLTDLELSVASTYDIKVEVVGVNGATDLTPENSTVEQTLDLSFGENQYTLNLLTDEYPEETSWALIDLATGEAIFEGAPSPDDIETNVSFTICVPDGAFALGIFDSFGDGMGGFGGPAGYIEVLDGDGNVVYELPGEDFASETYYLFCTGDGCLENTVAISEFDLPASFVACDPSASASAMVSILNEGNNDVASVDLLVDITAEDGTSSSSTETYTFSEALGAFEFGEIEVPLTFSGNGDYSVSVKVVAVNGESGADQTPANNLAGGDISVGSGDALYTFNLTSDDYPNETSWDIVDNATGTVVFAGTPSGSVTVTTYDLCFTNGSYTLTVYDSFGDGMDGFLGNGFIELIDDSGATIVSQPGEDFSDQISFSFCVGGACPDMPADFAATTASENQIDLSWTFSGTNDGFVLFRSKNEASGYAKIADLDATATSYSNTGLLPGTTYYYRLHAANSGVVSDGLITSGRTQDSGNAVVALFESFEGGAVPPEGWSTLNQDGDSFDWFVAEAPSYTAYTGDYSAASASWDPDAGALTPDNWLITPAVAIEAGFELSYYVAGQDPDYAAETYGVYISTTDNAPDSFTEVLKETLPNGTSEWYKNSVDLSSYAGETIYIAFRHFDVTDMFVLKLDDVYVGTPETSIAPPDPTDFTATAKGYDQVDLSWGFDATVDANLELYRSESGEEDSYELIGNFSQSVSLHSDMELAAGTTYFYRLMATNATGRTSAMQEVSATTGSVAEVTGFAASAVDYTRVALSWDAYSNPLSYVRIWMKDGDNYMPIATADDQATSEQIGGLDPQTTYTFAITGVAADGTNSAPVEVSVTTAAVSEVPNFMATILSATDIEVEWGTAPIAGSTLVLSRSVDGGAFTQLAQYTDGTTSLMEAGLEKAVYRYKMNLVTPEGFISNGAIAEGNLVTGLVDDFSGAVLSIYPNPTKGKLVVRLSEAKPLKISVFNHLGQFITTVNAEGKLSNSFEVNLENQKEGMYLLRIEDGNTVSTKKIVLH